MECLCTLKKNGELPNWIGKKEKAKAKGEYMREREPKKHII